MLIYLTTKFDIQTISFQIKPEQWNVCLVGETDKDMTKHLPGYSVDEKGRDTWTVEVCIDNGRIRNWPHGLDAEVSFYDKEGVYLLEDIDGNTITYIGEPPKCFRIIDNKEMSFKISENGYIEDWEMSIDLLKEWGSRATLTTDIPGE
jgi:hypothetical protein